MNDLKILLADDHDFVRANIVKVLKLGGFADLFEARDGAEAVDIFARENPDIVLLDMQMPNLNGLEACRRIRESSPDAKIVIMTMHEADDIGDSAFEAGANDYLLKSEAPIKLVDLIRKLAG